MAVFPIKRTCKFQKFGWVGKEKEKMKSCEATGKNIEQAIQNALFELKASREDVDIKILSEGGFLKKAKVLVSISEDATEKYEKKEQLKKSLEKEENDEDFAETFIKQKISQVKDDKAEVDVKVEIKEEKEGKAGKTSKIRIVADEEISAPIAKEEKTEKEERKEVERKLTGEEFLQGVLDALGLAGEIEKMEDEKFVRFNLTGENLNDLIGHHGDTMLALSHFMNLVCKKENRKKIVLDVENYRAKRAESLTALAKRVASKVAKTGRYYKFEPMDASERKIIHTALQDDDRVTTMSKGEEPHRYLIVFPREYKEN